ncbi:MAG: glycosyltransferase family 4 protein [Myxococcales bacterium]|nr:glycosyltransferase family 4 protein [Myxococcales bacterium]
MRIVLLNQYYPPDVAPTGRYLHDVGRELARRGHGVTAIASRHGYGGDGDFPTVDRVDGVRVKRLPGTAFGRGTLAGKAADYAIYCAGLAGRLAIQERPDVVVALTTPPFLGLLAKWTAVARRAEHVHWVMDVYPDVMEAHGMIEGTPSRALRSLAGHAVSGAHTIITLGETMTDRVRDYYDGNSRLRSVPLWAPAGLTPVRETPALRAERGWEEDRLVLLYSGNLGLGHRFDEFLEAARQLGTDGPRWGFAGEGRARPEVERFVRQFPELPIEMLPYVPDAQLRDHLCSADVHLVSLDSRWDGLIMPSKLQGSFAVGRPVIFVGSPASDLARWVEESGGGWVVAEGDVDGLIAAIAQAQDRAELRRRGAAAVAYAREKFDRGANVERMVELITGRSFRAP